MRKLFVTLFISCTLMVSAQLDTIRVLAIGNSFSVNSVEQNLYELGRQDSVVFIIGNLYIGSCSLKMHAKNIREVAPKYSYRKIVDGVRVVRDTTPLQYALQDEKWDFISMQQVSNTCGMIGSYDPWLTELEDSVRHYMQPGCRLLWHMTWAYQQDAKHPAFKDYGYSQQVMYDYIVTTAEHLMQLHPEFNRLIPTGTMVQNLRQTERFGDHLSNDGYHMNKYGQYGCACTWLEVLTNRSCLGNAWKPEWMTEEEQRVIQRAVHAAVMSPYHVNEPSINGAPTEH